MLYAQDQAIVHLVNHEGQYSFPSNNCESSYRYRVGKYQTFSFLRGATAQNTGMSGRAERAGSSRALSWCCGCCWSIRRQIRSVVVIGR
eukprot:6194555-Pleurochrysis_carterae.AAC.1